MGDIHDDILKISGKLDVISQRNQTADAIHADHETRLRMLERWRYAFPVSALASIAAVVLTIWQSTGGK